MALTKNALGNLINRYRSVLRKCRLINAFGSLAAAVSIVAVIAWTPFVGLAAEDKGGTDTLVTGWYVGSNGSNDNDDVVVGSTKYTSAAGGYARTSESVTAERNTLTIESGGSLTNAYGGFAHTEGENKTATASSNALTIKSGGSLNNAYGGYATLKSGVTGTAAADSNTLTIDGRVVGIVYGGYATALKGNSESGGHAVSTGNTVIINGGSFGANTVIYGGYVEAYNKALATGNTVVLGAGLGSTVLENVDLWGGKASRSNTQSEEPCNDVTGNTLKVRAGGLTVRKIGNFEKYVFAAGVMSAGSTVLSLSGQDTVLSIAADKVSIEADKPLSSASANRRIC